MKKILALVLALAMMLCMGTALAETTTTPSEAKNFTFVKKYVDENDKAIGDNLVPTEVLKFTSALKKTENSEYDEGAEPTLAIPDVTVSSAANTVTIQVPAYDKVGKFVYEVSETNGTTAGVTDYNVGDVVIQVTVLATREYDANGNDTISTEVQFTAKDDAGNKIDEFINVFETGSLEVKKTITGNAANKSDEFNVTVTFTSAKQVESPIMLGETVAVAKDAWTKGDDGYYTATADIKVTDGSDFMFTNIPVNVEYSVVEKEANEDGYVTTYDANVSGTIKASTTSSTTINNDKQMSVETGINMDSMPYIVLMGLVVLAGVALILKKRTVND